MTGHPPYVTCLTPQECLAVVACFPHGDLAQNMFRASLTTRLQSMTGTDSSPATSVREAVELATAAVREYRPDFEPDANTGDVAELDRRAWERAQGTEAVERRQPGQPNPLADSNELEHARYWAEQTTWLRHRFVPAQG